MRDITLRPAIESDKNYFISLLRTKQIYLKEITKNVLFFEISNPNKQEIKQLFENNGGNQFFNINYQVKNLPGTEDFLNRVSYDNSYNYFFQSYEEIAKQFGEQELPELYSIISRNIEDELIKVQSRQYFVDFISKFDEANSKKESKEIVTYISSDILEKESGLRNSFPYYNHIKINTIDKNNKFARKMKSSNLLDSLCEMILNNAGPSSYTTVKTEIDSKFVLQNYQLQGIQGGKLDKNVTEKLYKFDVSDDFETFYKKVTNSSDSNSYTKIETKTPKRGINPFSVIKLKNEFEKMKDSSVLDLLGQKDADVIMYEVRKIKEGKWISTYYLPNYKNEINFYDTQVVEDVEYKYEIYAFSLIKGMSLLVDNVLQVNSEEFQASYIANSDLYFLRVPWDNTELIENEIQSLYLKNAPPLTPEFNIVPDERKADSVRIMLKKRDGTEILTPQTIDNKEKAAIDKYKKIYNFNDFGYKVKYQADDSGTIFEVYRMTEPPQSYSDFSPTAISRIYQESEETFIDDIQPNMDYFYCARMSDINGNFSNPTKIWKIKVESNEGQLPVFVKDIYEFPKQSGIKERSFQKYVMIKPNPKQERLQDTENFDSAFEYGNPKMGKVFGKQYRVEITSKHTGKKVDVILEVKTPIIHKELYVLPKVGTNIDGSLGFDFSEKYPLGNSVENQVNPKKEINRPPIKISLGDEVKEAYDPGPIKFPIIPAK